MNIEKNSILYVDDEVDSLKYFEKAFSKKFSILTAFNANDGFKIIQENSDKIGVLLTDQRMPETSGVELLEKTKELNPAITRILVTAYSDHEASLDAVNKGKIFNYISKPWDFDKLKETLAEALFEHENQCKKNLQPEDKKPEKSVSIDDVQGLSYREARDILVNSLKESFFLSAMKKHNNVIARAAKEVGVTRRVIRLYLEEIGFYKTHTIRLGRAPNPLPPWDY